MSRSSKMQSVIESVENKEIVLTYLTDSYNALLKIMNKPQQEQLKELNKNPYLQFAASQLKKGFELSIIKKSLEEAISELRKGGGKRRRATRRARRR